MQQQTNTEHKQIERTTQPGIKHNKKDQRKTQIPDTTCRESKTRKKQSNIDQQLKAQAGETPPQIQQQRHT